MYSGKSNGNYLCTRTTLVGRGLTLISVIHLYRVQLCFEGGRLGKRKTYNILYDIISIVCLFPYYYYRARERESGK